MKNKNIKNKTLNKIEEISFDVYLKDITYKKEALHPFKIDAGQINMTLNAAEDFDICLFHNVIKNMYGTVKLKISLDNKNIKIKTQ